MEALCAEAKTLEKKSSLGDGVWANVSLIQFCYTVNLNFLLWRRENMCLSIQDWREYLGGSQFLIHLLKPSFTFSMSFYPSCQLICCFQFLSSFRILCMNWLVSCWFILLQAHRFIFLYCFYSTKSVAFQISSFHLLNFINSSYMHCSCCKFAFFMDWHFFCSVLATLVESWEK